MAAGSSGLLRWWPLAIVLVLAGLAAWIGVILLNSRPLDPDDLRRQYGAGHYCPDQQAASAEDLSDGSRWCPPLVEGVPLHVRISGPEDGPALLLIHGFGAHLQTWEGWRDRLDDTHRVIALDLPGHGLTGPDPSGDYTNDRTLTVIKALTDRLGLEQVIVAGNSLGGLMAWRFAAAYPQQTAGLILVAPGGVLFEDMTPDEPQEVPAAFRLIDRVLPRSLVDEMIGGLYGDRARVDAATIDRYHDLWRYPGNRKALIARMGQFTLFEPEPVLRTIRAPTLILWGDRDTLLLPEQAAVFDTAIEDSTLVMMPGAGHMPMEELPEESAAHARAFLDRITAEAARRPAQSAMP